MSVERPPIPPELARGYLTDEPGIPGSARCELEDFEVEEVPLYEPSGEGEHLYLTIEKRGIPTHEAVRRLARHFGIARRDVGTAGLKDARAVTRQTISLARANPADVDSLEDDQIHVLAARLHTNKLKIGHLRGNRFQLRLRGSGEAVDTARAVLGKLEARGVANYFGLQRFGRERNTHRLGEALVREDPVAFAELLLLGVRKSEEPPPHQPERLAAARELVRVGDYAAAQPRYPRSYTSEASLCRALAQGRSDKQALRAVAQKQRVFYVSAFQSLLFNAYLTRRLERLTEVELGEVVTLHRNGAAFVVDDVEACQARCDAFEISPSGPSFGRKLLRPAEGTSARALEDEVLAALAPGLGPELSSALGARPLGQRRPLRIQLSDATVEREGDDLRVAFFLPKGCYATSVLEELFKTQTD